MGGRRYVLILNRWAAFLHDIVWIPAALLIAYWIRFSVDAVPSAEVFSPWKPALVAVPVQAAAFWIFGLYRGIWRFASIPDLVRIVKAVFTGVSLTLLVLFLFDRLAGVPRSIMLLYPTFLVFGLTAPRFTYRWAKDHGLASARKPEQRALILGAGRAGELLIRDLFRDDDYLPIGILDDAPHKQGRELHGVRVIGKVHELAEKLDKLAIDVVLIAMPTAGAATMRKIAEVCGTNRTRCVTLPSLNELADGHVSVARLRELSIEDLLGRAPISLDNSSLHRFLSGKRVLVTGAGGSIGSELCRQVLQYEPQQLLLVDSGEFNLYSIEQEISEGPHVSRTVALLGDIRDESRMRSIFDKYAPQIVLHAAAYKHVPLIEENAVEGIKTNVFGTQLLADLSVEYSVEKFLLVSTDKAVNPTNIMGATKRVAEIYCQALNERSNTAFITTRFGNVLGSAGSVVPLFKRQIEKGGPITVTHPEISRFFMTIPESVNLILQAASMGHGGEIFVLDMGQPIRIADLAREMIRLSGNEPDIDIHIEYVGLRPGEKLHEELFHGAESLVGTSHPKILLAAARKAIWSDIQHGIAGLLAACSSRADKNIRLALQDMVPEFAQTGRSGTIEAWKTIHARSALAAKPH